MRTRVKICCISSREEAAQAVAAGCDALGLVSAMPSGPGVIGDDMIAGIASIAPPGVDTFLLTSKVDAAGIIAQHQHTRSSVIQLVDHVEPDQYLQIKKALPGIRLVQVLHVIDDTSISQALDYAKHADALLLDSGNPGLAVKELGGTGRTHNWEVSRHIVERVDVPVYLAGGLNSENVAEAIQKVKPFGLDLCSGVRTDGKLDVEKLRQFMEAVSATN